MIGKVALLFPGTGSQYIGMFKSQYEQYALVRETFDEVEEVLKLNLAERCFTDGFQEQLSIAYAQTAIFVCNVAAYRVYMNEVGIKPSLMAGHSLGELSALTCAGVFRVQDAAEAVWLRGEAMEAAVPEGGGAITAIKHLSAELVQEQCKRSNAEDGTVSIACYNSSDQIVIAGHRAAVTRVSEALRELGAQTITLNSNVPFHTSLMVSAADRLREKLLQIQLNEPLCPVLSNVTAKPYERGSEGVIDHLARQLTHPVRWEETVRHMQQEGISYAVELGPNSILKKLNRKTARNIRAYSWDEAEDYTRIVEMQRLKPALIDRCLSIAVATRNHNDDREQFEIGVVEPYKNLLRIQQECEQLGHPPSSLQMKTIYENLQSILLVKRVDQEEREMLLLEVELIMSGI
ncbi:ACP S-malonyltransferase [Cohnella sp. WQ 127256]|uniref:ACP S-malonyltransferase n=1 Tax=Cohnella sp. WQ 127256 TaxID=2938790 RepID=UPI00211775BD|nr:ACP S-malonyltransferase [Cohnella sp. WQ 127256]